MSNSVYVVISSNCEQWEDYYEHIDTIWLDRGNAVRHIEEHLGMTQVDFADPDRRWSRDRWLRVDVSRAQREDFDSDEEWREELADNGGEPPIIWQSESDAWIVELPAFSSVAEWERMRNGEEA